MHASFPPTKDENTTPRSQRYARHTKLTVEPLPWFQVRVNSGKDSVTMLHSLNEVRAKMSLASGIFSYEDIEKYITL